MATSFTTHSAGQVIASADVNLIQTAVNALENAGGSGDSRTHDPGTGSGGTNAGSSGRKGVLFTPSTNLTLTAVTCEYASVTANQTHNAVVCTLVANTGSTTVATVVGTTTLLTMASSNTGVTGGKVIMSFATGLALTSGVTYCILPGTPSDGGSNVGQQIFVPAFNGAITLTNPPGVLGDWCASSVATPTVGSAVTVVATTISRPSVGFTAK